MHEAMFFMGKSLYTLKVYWVHYTLTYNINVEKISSDKLNGAKDTLKRYPQAPTHHSLTLNLGFLYELKQKVRLSKTVCRIF